MIGRDLYDQLRRMLRPIQLRIVNSMARAILTLVDDSQRMQMLQLAGLEVGDGNREIIEDGEHFQPYGLYAVPQPGAEAVVIFPGGDRGFPLVVAVSDPRSRPTGGQPGEVALYTDEGDQVRLSRGHVIFLTTSGEIRAGGVGAVTPVALSSELAALKAAFTSLITSSADGAAIKAIFAAWSAPGSTKLKTE